MTPELTTLAHAVDHLRTLLREADSTLEGRDPSEVYDLAAIARQTYTYDAERRVFIERVELDHSDFWMIVQDNEISKADFEHGEAGRVFDGLRAAGEYADDYAAAIASLDLLASHDAASIRLTSEGLVERTWNLDDGGSVTLTSTLDHSQWVSAFWHDAEGRRHRDHGPAGVMFSGSIGTYGPDVAALSYARHGECITGPQGPSQVLLNVRGAGRLVEAVWTDEEGVEHRVDGPAALAWREDGTLEEEGWYQDGLLHRTDGPAELSYRPDGSLETACWYENGVLGRIQSYDEGGNHYYTARFRREEGERVRDSETHYDPDGAWHRSGGPAHTTFHRDGTIATTVWCEHGEVVEAGEFTATRTPGEEAAQAAERANARLAEADRLAPFVSQGTQVTQGADPRTPARPAPAPTQGFTL